MTQEEQDMTEGYPEPAISRDARLQRRTENAAYELERAWREVQACASSAAVTPGERNERSLYILTAALELVGRPAVELAASLTKQMDFASLSGGGRLKDQKHKKK
jgi:hypothetical protein